MLWVVMFHYHFEAFPLNVISKYGFTGVDFFLFLSGLGLYYSMHKNPESVTFYKRRLLRIFPTYILLGAIATFFLEGSNESITHFLWVCTTLGYWTNGDAGPWFIPALITLYFLFPFLYHSVFKRDDMKLFIVLLVCVFFLVLYWITLGARPMWFDNNDQRWLHVLLLYRVPIFMMGAFAGHVLLVRNDLTKAFIIASLICLGLSPVFYLQRTTMCLCFSTSLLSPVLILVLSLLVSKVKIIDKLGGAIGQASLEIYIIHMSCLTFVQKVFADSFNAHHDRFALIIMLVVVVLGVICHWLISLLTNLIRKYAHK